MHREIIKVAAAERAKRLGYRTQIKVCDSVATDHDTQTANWLGKG